MANWLDKTIGYFSPHRGLARARARHAMRIYEGASDGRRSSSWRAHRTSANAEISSALAPLRTRAHDLVRNTPHAPRMLDIMCTAIVGDGIRPVPNTGSDSLNDRVEMAWNEWQTRADVEGIGSFYEMQQLAVRSMIEAGELVIRFIDRDPKDVESKVPLQLQLLESDFIDSNRDGLISGIGGSGILRSRLGVGLGDYDQRTGLWLFPEHPGEIGYASKPIAAGYTSKFVPDEEVIHLFLRGRPGQVRGVSWFAPMLTTARDYADFCDAVTVKARVEACFSAFVTQADELEAVFTADGSEYAQPGSDAAITMMEPGTIKQLRPGQKIEFAQPTSTSQVESIMMFDLMAMAASVGVTYDQLSGDLRGANYSSLRAGKLDFRARVTQIQNLVIIPRLCERVWNRFISRSIIAGVLRERQQGYPCDWVTPAFESVNPKFDQDAEERSVRAGRMTPQEYYASWGSNWRKQLRDIQEFYKYADELGVSLDIDVRNYTRAGSAQPVPKAPGAPGDGTSPTNGAGGATTNGTGGSTGEPQPVMLVDINGDPIDLGDFNSPDGRGIDLESFPFGARVVRYDPNWSEEDHPRDPDGKFTEGGGGEGEGEGKAGNGASAGTSASGTDHGSGKDRPGSDGQSSGAYEAGSPGNAQGSGALSGATIARVFSPAADVKDQLEKQGATPLEFNELERDAASATVFRDAVQSAHDANKYGAAVTVHAVNDYTGMRLFVTADGKQGFALDGDNIVSAFKHPDSGAKDACRSMLPMATDAGGQRLDCFDTVLPSLYAASGFRAVARLAFDPKEAPSGWDETTFAKYNDGKPDVVFMVYDPANAKGYKLADGKTVTEYADGIAEQERELASKKRARRWDESEHPRGTGGKFANKSGGDDGSSGSKAGGGGGGSAPPAPKAPAQEAKSEVSTGTVEVREDWNEEDHPRDPDGKFTDAGGGGSEGGGDKGGGGETAPAAAPVAPPVDPEVVNVGGDSWNRETAVKLETDYAKARPAIEQIAKDVAANEPTVTLGEEEESTYVDSWDTMSGDQQSKAEQHFTEAATKQELEYEQNNYYESGQAGDDAAWQIAHDFSSSDEWATEAMAELESDRADQGKSELPFSTKQILDAINIQYDTQGELHDPDIYFVDDKLTEPKDYEPAQETLPGMEPVTPQEKLTPEMREEISNKLISAFKAEAEKDASDQTPPDYLEDSAKENVEMLWSEKSDDEKFEYAKQNDIITESDMGVGGGDEVPVAIPDTFDPLNDTQGRDYRETQALARHMSIERAVDVIRERGVVSGTVEDADLRNRVAKADHELWDGWKDSSTGYEGLILQLAIATELGGRYNEERAGGTTSKDLMERADKRYADIGGWAGVLAYTRGKWETTQYLLEKANIKTLDLYRAVGKDSEEIAAEPKQTVKEFTKLTDVDFKRNGAASFSVSRDVPNNWRQDYQRVVIRAQVPRTAVVSVPAYGINIHSEREVVLAGTAWKNWDAWARKAPDYQAVPMAQAA